jgi:chemotaxis receptor (MCP) glutamine deamidase CheD
MKKVIDVNTGEVKGCNDSSVLRSVAIGSCIAIVAYSSGDKAGAIAHVMLPGKAREATDEKTRYAIDAVDELICILGEFGVDQSDIEVCLVGAGNVLEKEDDTICDSNIRSVNEIMKEKNIHVRASVLGGVKRKSVLMDVAAGKVSYTEGNGRETFLWQACGFKK